MLHSYIWIERERSFVYAPAVRGPDVDDAPGPIITPAESKENPECLKRKFRAICSPRINIIVERHKFNTRFQTQDINLPHKIFIEYADLFKDELGKLPVTYSMKIDPDVQPVVRPTRRIPVAMQDRVIAELERMADLGVITPVSEPTEWVSSMVATNKKQTKDIRICIDPKDLNTALKRPHHPMRTVEEVASQMANATLFSVLDAKSSFWQISLDSKSSLLTTFSTPFGRYRFLRMPFGINSASEVFQRAMEQIFAGYPCHHRRRHNRRRPHRSGARCKPKESA
ncbi:hypothetical protein PO909_022102 [Leuciscus waleckii]